MFGHVFTCTLPCDFVKSPVTTFQAYFLLELFCFFGVRSIRIAELFFEHFFEFGLLTIFELILNFSDFSEKQPSTSQNTPQS